MFSLSNDRIESEYEGELNSKAELIGGPETTVYVEHWPAVKLGRFGVNKNWQRRGLGQAILYFLMTFFVIKNKTGCRYLLVDSYPEAESFYKKVGFERTLEVQDSRQNISMRYDLFKTRRLMINNPDIAKEYERMVVALVDKGSFESEMEFEPKASPIVKAERRGRSTSAKV